MGRCCNGVLATFRVIQFLLSLVALACGVYITYKMYSISESAHELETSIKTLQDDAAKRQNVESSQPDAVFDQNVKDAVDTLASVLIPVLRILQGTPVRAIIVSVVGLWSLIVIAYLFFAHRSKNHPRANKKSLRVMLELATLLLCIVSIVCSIMLALQYGIMAVSGGVEVKIAFKVCRGLIKEALQQAVESAKSSENILRALDIVSDIVTIGGLSIASVSASAICGVVSLASLIVACCMSGKHQSGYEYGRPMSAAAEPLSTSYAEKTPMTHTADVNSSWQSRATLAAPYQYSENRSNGRQVV